MSGEVFIGTFRVEFFVCGGTRPVAELEALMR